MHRTEADNRIVVSGKNQYTDGPPGTTLTAVDKNTIQEEIANIIEQAGLTLKVVSTETNTQLKEAVSALITSETPDAIQAVDFSSKNLIINVQSNTQVDAAADELALINSSNILAFTSNLNTTFNIITDLMADTSEKASHWYQMWIDSSGVRLLVPDLESTADGNTLNKLVDSLATFVTDKVQVGDRVYNLTDLTQGTVVNVVNNNIITLSSDFFPDGNEDYKIRALSPVGLGSFKARIGAAFNNSSSNFDDSTYTQIQERKDYIGGIDFTITDTNYTLIRAKSTIYQVNDWTGQGSWEQILRTVGTYSVSVTAHLLVQTGIIYKNVTNFYQAAISDDVGSGLAQGARAIFGTGNIQGFYNAAIANARYTSVSELDRKPTFHN